MPQHYTKDTTEAIIFCAKCMDETRWRVADGRRQYCLKCYEKAETRRAAERAALDAETELRAMQGSLFGGSQ